MIKAWVMIITREKQVFAVMTLATTYMYYLAYKFELSQNPNLKKPYPRFLSQDSSSLVSYTRVSSATNGSCHIPDINPFDPRALQFLSYRPSIKCGNLQPTLTYIDLEYIVLNDSAVNEAGWKKEDLKCTYVEIDRVTGRDDDVTYGPRRSLEDRAAVQTPVVQVQCENKRRWGNVYETVHYVLNNLQRPIYSTSNQEKEIHESDTHQNSTHSRKMKNARPPNVLILAVDGLSRLNALRLMPQTMKYLEKKLKSYTFRKHVKCGSNSFPNIAALMTGRRSFQWDGPGFSKEPELPHCKEKSCDQDYIDEWPFIWKEFERRGYRTAYGEDRPYIGIYNFLMKGFLHAPTHHYFRPFWIAEAFLKSSGSIASRSKEDCFLNVPEYQYVLNQAMDIQKLYQSQPHFSYFHTSVAHADINVFQILDIPINALLTQLKEDDLLENTFFILMGDHGCRFGEFRKTWLGRMDDNLPLFSMFVPDKIRQRYPHLHGRLQANLGTLTSWYDVHATLMDIVTSNYGLEVKEWNPHGKSFFSDIHDRSCEETEIPLAFCPCMQESKVSLSNDNVIKSANVLVDALNQWMMKFSIYCSMIKLKDIVEASVIAIEKVKVGLRLVVTVEPSGGIFETTMTFDNQKQRYTVTEEVQRLDQYKDQGSCISDKEYRPYCHCR